VENVTDSNRNQPLIGILGTGGFAREVMPYLLGRSDSVTYLESSPTVEHIDGIPVQSVESFLVQSSLKYFNISVADSGTRERFAAEFEAAGAQALTITADTAVVFPSCTIGRGAILCANTMVTANATIGTFFHANIYSYVAHDCIVGDFVTLAPRASINGNVHVGDHAYIGTGALVKQGQPGKPLVIGERAVVGMGAVVTKDVAPNTTVVGNPARVLEPSVPPQSAGNQRGGQTK
jgi:sugar O-acyltransferase (sialic acid O-acetyltransferase NeuD family)